MGNAGELAGGLLQRAPGQALIEKLLDEWDAGRIRANSDAGHVVIDEEARGWYWGVLGERRVAQYLSQLPSEWTVLHSVPIGAGATDVDHLAIGPSGVFALNSKYSPGARVWVAGRGLMVNGTSRAQYLRASMSELHRVTSVLSSTAGFAVPVTAAIVFVNPEGITARDTAGWDGQTIDVIPDAEIYRLLDRRREMSDEQLQRVVAAAVRPETWHHTFRVSRSGEHLAREFDALRAAVGPALDHTRSPVAARSQRARPSGRPAQGRGPRRSGTRERRQAARRVDRMIRGVLGLVFPLIGLITVMTVLSHLSSR